MCMFDKMFEEGGHKFQKGPHKYGPNVTNPKVTGSYNPRWDPYERDWY
jgi:hypothetical protein